MSVRYRVNAPQTVHQTIDDEVVLINLGTGNYYSLRGSGAEIWGLLENGLAEHEVAETIADRHDTPREDVERAVKTLSRQLLEEGLLRPADGTAASPPISPEAPPELDGLEPPVLEKYDDMQDLILLDPVHEVDEEEGWPHRSQPAS